MVFLIVIIPASIVLAQEELNQNNTDNGTFVINDSESITITIEGIHSSSISSGDSINEFENVGKMIIDIISHPLFILLIGAWVTKVLIPRFTNNIQVQKENFEIKKELIKKINSSTTELLVITQMIAKQEIKKEKVSDEFLKWTKSCAEIGATVRAHWDDGKNESVVEKEWNRYYDSVLDLYNIITNLPVKKKRDKINKDLKSFFKSYNPVLRLEYEIDDVDTIIEDFFKIVDELDEYENNLKKYSEALFELVYLFDKRKYYLLKLIFRNTIRNQ